MKTNKKYPVNDRIIEKMKDAGMDESTLAMAAGLPKQTIYNIVKKEVKPNRSTVEAIARGLKANFLYLLTGKEGELSVEPTAWQELVNEVRSKNEHLMGEINFYRQIISNMTGKGNFRQGLNLTGLAKTRQLRPHAA